MTRTPRAVRRTTQRARLASGPPVAVDRSSAAHYVWGMACDGWRLLDHEDLSVIEERVPGGAGEVRHFHSRARQVFYVLSGHAEIEMEKNTLHLAPGQAVHVPPGVRHRFVNRSSDDVRFLVISSPSTLHDRTNVSTDPAA